MPGSSGALNSREGGFFELRRSMRRRSGTTTACRQRAGYRRDFAERVLGFVESNAASAIQRLERGETLSLDDRHYIALLLALQHRRTPAGRRDLRFMDEMLAKLDAELRIGHTEHVRRVLSSDGRKPTGEEISEWQEQTLRELAEGQLIIESTPDREVALMFMALDRMAPMLVEQFDWMFLDIETDVGEVVLPDVGVTLLDPTPPFDGSGTRVRFLTECRDRSP